MKKKSLKNRILKTVMTIVFFVCAYSACALDAPTWIPTIIFVVTLGILALFAFANNWFGECDE